MRSHNKNRLNSEVKRLTFYKRQNNGDSKKTSGGQGLGEMEGGKAQRILGDTILYHIIMVDTVIIIYIMYNTKSEL